MDIEVAKMLVLDIIDMNGGTIANPAKSRFIYSPIVNANGKSIEIIVQVYDTFTKKFAWASGDEIIAQIHDITAKMEQAGKGG